MIKNYDKEKIVFDSLSSLIPNAKSELEYSNEFELLVAVMLSAQCTDKRVNIITRELFKKFKTPEDFACLTVEELENYIKSCNYYHNKAKNIILASKQIVERFGGKVPSEHGDLVSLAGVGNKTANVIEVVCFGKQSLPVDTHCLRVSNRLGFVNTSNPDVCEKKMKELFKDYSMDKLHHLLVLFGRYYCTARNPKCDGCILKHVCEYVRQKEN
jgi:endonuclease-3